MYVYLTLMLHCYKCMYYALPGLATCYTCTVYTSCQVHVGLIVGAQHTWHNLLQRHILEIVRQISTTDQHVQTIVSQDGMGRDKTRHQTSKHTRRQRILP